MKRSTSMLLSALAGAVAGYAVCHYRKPATATTAGYSEVGGFNLFRAIGDIFKKPVQSFEQQMQSQMNQALGAYSSQATAAMNQGLSSLQASMPPGVTLPQAPSLTPPNVQLPQIPGLV